MFLPALLRSAALLLLAAPALSAAVPSRPNVLFLIADDLNNNLGCYGDPRAKTPNLDKLAARGVRFDQAYCTYPLCGPSRNSMLTGLYPNSSGILGNSQIFRQTIPNHISLPQAFRHQDYRAVRIGKLYHYAVPTSIGTDGHDDPASWEVEFNPAGVDRLEEESKAFSLVPGNFGGVLSWYASPKPDQYHTDGKIAADAEWVLERAARERDRPFFLAVGFFRPHTPYIAPRDPYFGYYPEADMPVVTGIAEDQKDIPAPALASRRPEDERMTDPLKRQAVQAYYASISFMDTQVGRIIAALDRHGLAENTIIVFTSDHGYHLGEHGLWKKQSIFEESARVPLFIVAPGRSRAGAVVRAPVSHLDLYPTLAELAGVKAPANLQGQSLAPLLANPAAPSRGWAISQVGRNSREASESGVRRKAQPAAEKAARKAVAKAESPGSGRFFGYSLRTERWRYTEWDGGSKGRELYDHSNDPKELRNLASEPAHAATIADLSRQLSAAVKSTYPADGQTPPLRDGLWLPVIVP